MSNSNMGGITFVNYIYPEELEIFAVTNQKIVIRLKTGHQWRDLPITRMSADAQVTQEDTEAGTVYRQSISMNLIRNKLTDAQLMNLHHSHIKGVLIRYTDTKGNHYLMGSVEYPLFGNLQDVPGQNPEEFSGYTLTLTNTLLHPQLPVQEI